MKEMRGAWVVATDDKNGLLTIAKVVALTIV
jgi:hypothetical protein